MYVRMYIQMYVCMYVCMYMCLGIEHANVQKCMCIT